MLQGLVCRPADGCRVHGRGTWPAQWRVPKSCVTQRALACRLAEGTLIARQRDMAGAVMTSIVLKSGVTLMDIVSTRMLGQFGFLGKVFDIFRANEISVDVVATSEISISLTLDPRCARAGRGRLRTLDLLGGDCTACMSLLMFRG